MIDFSDPSKLHVEDSEDIYKAMALHTLPDEKMVQDSEMHPDASNPEPTAEPPQEMSAFQAYKVRLPTQ